MITLWINNNGGWDWTKTTGQRTKVTFEGPEADAMATRFIMNKGYLVIEPDEDTDWTLFPLTYDIVFPTCEHGMSMSLCHGPNHYPMDY